MSRTSVPVEDQLPIARPPVPGRSPHQYGLPRVISVLDSEDGRTSSGDSTPRGMSVVTGMGASQLYLGSSYASNSMEDVVVHVSEGGGAATPNGDAGEGTTSMQLSPTLKVLKEDLSDMRSELKQLEHEQRVSNERQLAAARRKLREKKRSEIARRLVEAQRLQTVMARKLEEEEEKKKKRNKFQDDMQQRAEKHLKDAQSKSTRLFKVLGLRRLDRVESASLLTSEVGSPFAGAAASSQLLPPALTPMSHDKQAHQGPVSTLPRIAVPAETEAMAEQRQWMSQQVAFIVQEAKQREAQAAERRRSSVGARSLGGRSGADDSMASPASRGFNPGSTYPLSNPNAMDDWMDDDDALVTRRTEVLPELLDVKRQLRELGVETAETEDETTTVTASSASSPTHRTNFLIQEGKDSDEEYARQMREERVQRSLMQLHDKERNRQMQEALLSAGDAGMKDEDCVRNGIVLAASSEENQRLSRGLPPLPQSQILSPRGGKGFGSSAVGRPGLTVNFTSGTSTPVLTPLSSTSSRGRSVIHRPVMTDAEQAASDNVALAQAQHRERFVSQLRKQKDQLLSLKSKLVSLTELTKENAEVTEDTSRQNETSDAADDTTSVSSRPTTTAAVAQERELAAIAIQHQFRRMQCGQLIANRKRQHREVVRGDAATTIQHMWIRREAKRKAAERRAQHNEARRATMRQEAAVLIQSLVRAHLARKKLKS